MHSKPILRHIFVALVLLFSLSCIALVNPVEAETTIDVTVDTSKVIGTNDYSIGFSLDHVTNIDERDFLSSSAIRQLAKDAGFKMIRIVDFRNMKPCTKWYESSKTGSFNWAVVDDVVQKIFEVGAEPLVVLGCFTGWGATPIVPSGMSINSYTGLPNPESFAAYCAEWVKHFKSKGVPVRFYEVMNEAWYYFWDSWGCTNNAKLKNFVTLLNTVYDSMRAVDNKVLIGTDGSTTKSFLDYFAKNGRGLGFLSFHKYDSGSTSDSDSTIFKSAETSRFETTTNFYSPEMARQIWYNSRGMKLPVINSETNLSWLWASGTDPRIQKMSGAVWTALMIKACITKGVQYSIYYRLLSSKNQESTKRTGGYGFGMINSDNDQPWYPYYVHKMIGNNLKIGNLILSSSSSSSEISPLAWVNGNKLNLLLICKVNSARSIRLRGISGQLNYFKVDNTISWLLPRMQTGVVNSINTVNLNGYTVMLLQQDTTASNPSPSSAATVSFNDGFESGSFSKWTGIMTTSGETVTVATMKAHHGTYHGKFTTNAGGQVERAYCYKNLAATSEIYARCYIYIQNGLPLRDEGDRFNVIAIQGTSGQTIASVTIQRGSGIDRWAIRSSAGNFQASKGPSMIQWYCVEFYAKIGTTGGIYRLWINGQLVIEKTGLNTATQGNVNSVHFGLTYLSGVTNNVNLYGDCFEVSDTYIGLET